MDKPLDILIIEDSPIDQKILLSIIKKLKIHYLVCDTFLEGMEKVRELKPKLLLLDLNLPDGHGVDLLKRISEYADWGHLRVFVTSAASEDELDCLGSVGAERTFQKPINRKELEEAIKEVFSN